MALTLPAGVGLHESIARAERDNNLVGMDTDLDWSRATVSSALAAWRIDKSYAETAPDRFNRPPSEAEVQSAIDAIVAERSAVDAKLAQDAADKTRAIELAEKAAVVVDRKDRMSFEELEASHKDLSELVHTMARKLGFE